MSTSNKLKAFVRFDGSGRVVPSSVILARFKPKVGNYQEIDAYECCNDVPTTTTTTTQGGGVTPTAWVVFLATSNSDACNQINGYTAISYTSTPTITIGTIFYTDAALNQVVLVGSYAYFKIGTSSYTINPATGSVINISSC
jgi:hypothetical protein